MLLSRKHRYRLSDFAALSNFDSIQKLCSSETSPISVTVGCADDVDGPCLLENVVIELILSGYVRSFAVDSHTTVD